MSKRCAFRACPKRDPQKRTVCPGADGTVALPRRLHGSVRLGRSPCRLPEAGVAGGALSAARAPDASRAGSGPRATRCSGTRPPARTSILTSAPPPICRRKPGNNIGATSPPRRFKLRLETTICHRPRQRRVAGLSVHLRHRHCRRPPSRCRRRRTRPHDQSRGTSNPSWPWRQGADTSAPARRRGRGRRASAARRPRGPCAQGMRTRAGRSAPAAPPPR
mmetsp:Transcript_101372/g.292138  ORF Transcript_101372/g.292138 Transcript_101372/m.292138 type:complete len:220 (-) Transcript_101372:455-1114(-)